MTIVVDVDVMLAHRKMAVGALAEQVRITPANLAVLENGRAKAVRFSTLDGRWSASPGTSCGGSRRSRARPRGGRGIRMIGARGASSSSEPPVPCTCG